MRRTSGTASSGAVSTSSWPACEPQPDLDRNFGQAVEALGMGERMWALGVIGHQRSPSG